jgi:predicted ribonuclease YlaK
MDRMPTNLSVKTIKTKHKKRARISLSFEFDIDDPRAVRIFNGVASFVREALSEDERVEFMRLVEVERAKLAA